MPREDRSGRLSYFSGTFGCIVTFWYDDGPHTVWDTSQAHAYEQARRRWGDEWVAEPVVSTPNSILRDIKGITALEHGTNFYTHIDSIDRRRRKWFRFRKRS